MEDQLLGLRWAFPRADGVVTFAVARIALVAKALLLAPIVCGCTPNDAPAGTEESAGGGAGIGAGGSAGIAVTEGGRRSNSGGATSVGGVTGNGGQPASCPSVGSPRLFDSERALFCKLLRLCCESEGFGTQGLAECECWALPNEEAPIDAGLEVADAELVNVCVAELDAKTTSCVFGLEAFVEEPSKACKDAITGTVPTGGDCASSEGRCAGEDGLVYCDNFCHPSPIAGPGEPCAYTRSSARDGGESVALLGALQPSDPAPQCLRQDGLTCQRGSTGLTCQPVIAQGGTCRYNSDCASGLYCDGAMKCQTKKAHGASCSASLRECDHGMSCDGGKCLYSSRTLCETGP